MREIKVNAVIRMEIEDNITEEEANNILYDMMFNGLCRVAPIDFELYDSEVREKY